MREKIETFVSAWEKKAKGSMHLDALLAKPIKEKLINGLVEIFEAEMAKPPSDIYPPKPDEDSPAPATKAKRKGKAQ